MKKLEVVRQDGKSDCGVSCLLTIVRYYGGNVSKEYLRELTHTGKEGVSAYYLIETARKLGFQAKGIKGDFRTLLLGDLPVIAHVQINNSLNHFVVLIKVEKSKERIILLDPSRGIRHLSFTDFDRITTKQFLYLKPCKKLPQMRQNHKIRTLFLTHLKNYSTLCILLFLLSFFFLLFRLITTFSFKYFLDYVVEGSLWKNAPIILAILFLVIFLKLLTDLFRKQLFLSLEKKLNVKLFLQSFQHVIMLPYLYYKNRTTGEVINRLQEVGEITNFCHELLLLFPDLVFTLVLFFLLALLSIPLFLCTISICFFSFFILVFTHQRTKEQVQNVIEGSAFLNNSLVETIQAIDTIKGLHLEDTFIDKVGGDYEKLTRDTIQLSKRYFLLYYVRNHIVEWGNVLFLFLGVHLVLKGSITLGTLIAYQNLLPQVNETISQIASMVIKYQNVSLAMRRLRDLYDVGIEDFRYQKKYELNPDLGEIEIRNLTYEYHDKKRLFEKLSLSIQKGEKVLLYGESGCGKSTLMKLLLRYLEIPSDRIFLSKEEIHQYHLNYLREHITYVSQNEMLFTNSIYQNIVLGRVVDYQDFLKVVKLTMVDELIQDKKIGYDQLIEENGFNLSGGERQRIILARALLKESDLYIFDEAFNQIDIEKERIILERLFTKLQDKTIIVISHRYHNNDLFTKTIKLENGVCHEGIICSY